MLPHGGPGVPRDTWANLMSSSYLREPKLAAYKAARESPALLQRMSKLHSLNVHRGCVNTIWWDDSGQYILSGSDDHRLIITEPYSKKIYVDVHTSHRANIFSAKFLPHSNIRKIVSCAGDGNILYTDLARIGETHNCNFNCHSGTTYELLTVPDDPHTFLSCGEDGTVRWFDLRTKDKCRKSECREDILLKFRNPVTSMSINPMLPYYLAVGTHDSAVRLFDRRMLETKACRAKMGLVSRFLLPQMESKDMRITALDYRPDGQEILVSFSSDYIYIFNPDDDDPDRPKKLCVGRRPKEERVKSRKSFMDRSPPPMRRFRLRGDWSDTGPNARPESPGRSGGSGSEGASASANSESTQESSASAAQAPSASGASGSNEEQSGEPSMGNLMQQMSEALSRMLNDPSTRLAMRALSAREAERQQQQQQQQQPEGGQAAGPGQAAEAPGTSDNAASGSATSSSNQGWEGPTSHEQQEEQERKAKEEASASAETDEPPVSAASAEKDPAPSAAKNEASETQQKDEDTEEVIESEAPDAIGHRLDSIRDSITTMREEYLESHDDEPNVDLNLRDQGVESSTISMRPGSSSGGGLDNNNSNNNTDETTTSEDEAPRPPNPDIEVHEEEAEVDAAADEDEPVRMLPGPRQVIGDHGESGTNPVTEPYEISTPTHASPPSEEANEPYFSDDDCCEYDLDEAKENPEDNSRRFIRQPKSLRKFTGHRNTRTMIKEATWWGNKFVLSGSDCGHIFGWERETGNLVLLLEADRHVVNCIQPHPYDPIIASSGIDYDVKIWVPSGEGNTEPLFDEKRAQELTKMNEVMLEETADTITVPASVMIRMLASLNHYRRAGRLIPRILGRRREQQRQEQEQGQQQQGQDQPGDEAGEAEQREESEDDERERHQEAMELEDISPVESSDDEF